MFEIAKKSLVMLACSPTLQMLRLENDECDPSLGYVMRALSQKTLPLQTKEVTQMCSCGEYKGTEDYIHGLELCNDRRELFLSQEHHAGWRLIISDASYRIGQEE